MSERDIFLALLDIPDAGGRAAFLDGACAGDGALRARVESLFRSHEAAGDFLATPGSGPTMAYAGPDAAGATRTDGGRADDGDEALAFLAPAGRPGSLGRLRHYEMMEVLGRGGFGIVFRAFDGRLQRDVAVKVLAPTLAVLPHARKRFLREARSAAAVRHENVVAVYEVEEEPLPHLAMELVPGESLQQWLGRACLLPVAEAVRIAREVAEGLAAAHAAGLVHRDIKPSNILIDASQHRARIADFGLARAVDDASLTRSGVLAGTPMYMAPEQARGEAVDGRADLFSLGSVLYAMLAGRPPFGGDSTPAVLKRVAEDDPPPLREAAPGVPEWLCRIVAKLHEKGADRRFQSAREVADLLADCEAQMKAHGEVRDQSRLPAPPRVWPWRRIVVAAALLVLPLAIWGGRALTVRSPVDGSAPGDTLEREDLARLQGEWVARLAELDGKPLPINELEEIELRVGERDFEIRQKGKDEHSLAGTFRIDVAKKQLLLFPRGEKVPIRVGYRFREGRLRLDFAGLAGPAEGGPQKGPPLRIAERTHSQNNLKQLALAMHNYEHQNKSLPPPALTSTGTGDGKSLLSWRVAILPYIEEGVLYRQFKLDEPWDGPHNKKLIPKMPRIYMAPGITAGPGMTHYRAFVGPGSVFERRPGRAGGTRLNEIFDGTSNTLLIAEAAEAVAWTSPDDLPFDAKTPLAKLGVSAIGAAIALCDGSVRTLAPDPPEGSLRGLITRNGGELVTIPYLSDAPQAPPLYLELQRRGEAPAPPG